MFVPSRNRPRAAKAGDPLPTLNLPQRMIFLALGFDRNRWLGNGRAQRRPGYLVENRR